MNKEVLRKVYLEKRLFLSEKEKTDRDQKLFSHFLSHISLQNISYLHIFLPIEKKKEPDTWLLIDQISKDYPQIRFVIPSSEDNGDLKHYVLKDKSQLKFNKWGIPEPEHGEQISPELLDFILVPLIIFDKKGHRIGYGKGYYDRFLELCRPDAKKIGYSLHMPLDVIPYTDEHDIPLDGCIYPEGYWEFSVV
ncbi:MAG: 5-formyltetrahydrofolate cyclo-ligase [Cyclobacteriaceae bacterium]|nr:5-formyltetrahydrofolate cyclo-ligase [Cyclobacteriaceae bacterium]